MKKEKQELINYTKEFWQPYYQQELTEKDAVEIVDNMTAFFNLLSKWKKAKQQKESCKILDNRQ